ncbi:hypothetical protein B0J12DRAFT_76316 [Macrophomina phaseolina]|uniref:Uncharacterized protein n=1 Tax=Macrophomina phaseolina TaxID=35725 RepID=A0ABQ8GBR5_9PEZI|nr:hypothetical protein B0J12DRAFT_76316 [Macrophomina phaseolina]
MAHSSMCGASRGSFRRYTGSNRRQAKELDKCRHVARYFCSHSAGLLRIWVIILNASQQAGSLNTISRFDHALSLTITLRQGASIVPWVPRIHVLNCFQLVASVSIAHDVLLDVVLPCERLFALMTREWRWLFPVIRASRRFAVVPEQCLLIDVGVTAAVKGGWRHFRRMPQSSVLPRTSCGEAARTEIPLLADGDSNRSAGGGGAVASENAAASKILASGPSSHFSSSDMTRGFAGARG